ncbi:MAG: hypothetical protein HY662_02645 [Chloroflexi bacterium]|nr:hypothetical protein [Chloroflexota bacterium]
MAGVVNIWLATGFLIAAGIAFLIMVYLFIKWYLEGIRGKYLVFGSVFEDRSIDTTTGNYKLKLRFSATNDSDEASSGINDIRLKLKRPSDETTLSPHDFKSFPIMPKEPVDLNLTFETRVALTEQNDIWQNEKAMLLITDTRHNIYDLPIDRMR